MRIKILTEGGKNIGFGHITRCMALWQAVKETDRNIDTQFIVSADTKAKSFMRKSKIAAVCYDWYSNEDKLMKAIQPDEAVVIDSYLAPAGLYRKLSKKLYGHLLMIDDYSRIKYPKGIIVNPSVSACKFKYERMKGRRYFLGNKYVILRKDFWKVPKLKMHMQVRNILITLGGMENTELLKNIAIWIKQKYDFNITLVDPLKTKYTAAEMLKMMRGADICISGGGQTTYELARLGVPTIGIYLADNQKMNLECWEKIGFIENAGSPAKKGFYDSLQEAIEKLHDNKEREKRSKLGYSEVDGLGALRIVREFIGLCRC